VVVGIVGLVVDSTWEWPLLTVTIISCITVYVVRRCAVPGLAGSDEPDLNGGEGED